MSKLSDYLEKKKIDPRRLLAASKDLEQFRPEDRAIALAKVQVKGADEKAKEKAKEKAAAKPRGGRSLSKPALERALRGEKLKRRARARVLRAVNHVLTVKKQKAEAKSPDLF
jgi:hypothetical protein